MCRIVSLYSIQVKCFNHRCFLRFKFFWRSKRAYARGRCQECICDYDMPITFRWSQIISNFLNVQMIDQTLRTRLRIGQKCNLAILRWHLFWIKTFDLLIQVLSFIKKTLVLFFFMIMSGWRRFYCIVFSHRWLRSAFNHFLDGVYAFVSLIKFLL